MSHAVRDLVWRHSRAPLVPRFVLVVIADCADDKGQSRVSYRTIQQRTSLVSRNSIAEAVRWLEEAGELLVKRPDVTGGSNRYAINLPLFRERDTQSGASDEPVANTNQSSARTGWRKPKSGTPDVPERYLSRTKTGTSYQDAHARAREGGARCAVDPIAPRPAGPPTEEEILARFRAEHPELCDPLPPTTELREVGDDA